MKKLITIVWLSLLSLLLFSGCSYNGDGEFHSGGFWPIKYYSLSLPEFEFRNGTTKEYNLGNYKGNTHTIIYLTLKSDKKIIFLDTNIQMSFVVQDKKGNSLLTMNEDVFKSMHRLQDTRGIGSTWNSDEWRCEFQYGDQAIDNHMAPFSDKKSLIQSELLCWVRIKTPPSNPKILLKIEKIEPGYDLKASIEIASGAL